MDSKGHEMPRAQPALPSHVEILSPAIPVSFDDSWYDLTDSGHFWMQWRLRELKRLLVRNGPALTAPLRSLDVGGGHGILRTQLEANSTWSVDLADVNAAALSVSAAGRGRTMLYDVTEERADLVGQYDVAFLFDVIEHLGDPGPLLRSTVRHLKPGGWLLINVPAHQRLFSSYDIVIGHFRRYDRRRLAAELDAVAREVDMVAERYWGGLMLPLLVARRLLQGCEVPAAETDRATMIRRGMQPPSRRADLFVRGLMAFETALPVTLGLGTSLMALLRRNTG